MYSLALRTWRETKMSYRPRTNNFNKEKALQTKGITNFGWNEMSDIDGFHTCNEYVLVIENKFVKERSDDYQIDKIKSLCNCINNCIFVETSNENDIRNNKYEDKIINLWECKIQKVITYNYKDGEFYKEIEKNFIGEPLAKLINFLESHYKRQAPFDFTRDTISQNNVTSQSAFASYVNRHK